MPHNPPPAPDWVMGDDGHWKPPPFVLGHDPTPAPPQPAIPPSAAVPQSPPGAPGGGAPGGLPPLAPRPRQSTGAVVAWVLGGLAVAFVALVGVCILAVTLLGTSSEQKFEAVDVGPSASGGPSDGVDDGRFVPVEPDPEVEAGTGTATEVEGSIPGPATDPEVFCPTPTEVAQATGLPESETTVGGGPVAMELVVNSVRTTALWCEVGSAVDVMAVVGPERDTFLDDLRGSGGPAAVTDSSDAMRSVDVVERAPEPGGGSVRVVFEAGGEVYSVARDGQDLASLGPVVDAVRARVE